MKTFALAAVVSVSLTSVALAGETKTTETKKTAVAPSFASLDVDGDGFVTSSEATEAASLFNAFKSLDIDGDGKLSADEFAKFEVAAGSKEDKAATDETSKG